MTAAIKFENISKRYRIGRWLPTLRGAVSKLWGTSDDADYHWAVKDVSFELQPGEALGIIGPNGAGKTTILKILSRVTQPSSGTIEVNGRFSALIELGAGFHPDLTGRENVFLNGTILGMKRGEIKERFDQIVEFAGIGQYLDTPVKRYSSGMHARLGFAIAAHVDPDVLLVDEVLAVGDYAFQQKCYARMDELRENGTSLIFVSHNMEVVRRVCDQAIVMYGGKSIFRGTAVESVIAYSDAVREAARKSEVLSPGDKGKLQRVMTFDAEIIGVKLTDKMGMPVTTLQSGTIAKTIVSVLFHRDVSSPIFSFFVRTVDGRTIYDTTTRWRKIPTPDFTAGDRCLIEFTFNVGLIEGEYELGVDVGAPGHYYDRIERALSFLVLGPEGAKGLVDLNADISFKKEIPEERLA